MLRRSRRADALELLEAPADAKRVRKWKKKGGSGEHIKDAEALSEACLKSAVGSNLNRRAEGAVA